MLIRDLMSLPVVDILDREIPGTPEPDSARISPAALRALDLDLPEDVLEQFLSHHARKPEFQEQYAQIDLRRVRWSHEEHSASDLAMASVFSGFRRYVDECAEKYVPYLQKDGFRGLAPKLDFQYFATMVASWEERGSWLRAPVFVSGDLVGSGTALHLVEGHTRVAALRACVAVGLLPPDSRHRVWIGRPL